MKALSEYCVCSAHINIEYTQNKTIILTVYLAVSVVTTLCDTPKLIRQ